MGIYWTVLACSVLFWWFIKLLCENGQYTAKTQDIENKSMIAYFFLMATFMITMIGLRSDIIGIDTPGYYYNYKLMSTRSFSYLLDNNVAEKAYAFLQILCNKLKISFYGFNFIYALFSVFIISYLIYKKSTIPWLSYIFYICFDFFVLDFTMIRQTYAMSIVIMALLIDKNKGIKDFLIFVAFVYLASLFHSSAIICLPLWFVRKLSFNKKSVGIFLLLIVLSYLLQEQIADLTLNIAGSINERYEQYFGDIRSKTNGLRLYLMMLVTVIFSLFFNKHLENPWNSFMFYCICIMLILFPAVQNSGGATMRVYYYFYIFMIVYIPNMLNSLDKKKDLLPYWAIIALYVIVGISLYSDQLTTNSFFIVPYKFFWQI